MNNEIFIYRDIKYVEGLKRTPERIERSKILRRLDVVKTYSLQSL